MKYLVFYLTLFVAMPFGLWFFRTHPKYRNYPIILAVFFTCYSVHINFVSMEWYRGTSKGFEFLLVDIFTLLTLLLLFTERKFRRFELPPGSYLYFIYFFFSAISIVNSAVYVYTYFELFKMFKIYLFYWTVYNSINDRVMLRSLLRTISFTVIFVFFYVAKQKYIDHTFQAMGTFPHQNSMCMYLNLYTSIIFAYLLTVTTTWNLVYWLYAFGSGMGGIISSLSRAGMLWGGLSMSFILMASIAIKPDVRKVFLVILMILMVAGFILKARNTIIERFQTAPEESTLVRIELAHAATNMANDKVLGIGLNNFGHKINPPYWYGSHIVFESEDERAGLVETIYLMIAAETGWHNLVVFIVFIFYMYIMNIVNLFKTRDPLVKAVCLGLIGGLGAIYVGSTLEWVLKQNNNFYQLVFAFAVIGAISRKLIPQERMAQWSGM